MRACLNILIVIAGFLFAGAVTCYGQEARVLLVVAPTKNHPAEYGVTRKELTRAKCEVKVACKGLTAKDLTGKEIPVDLTLEEVRPEKFDAVAVIGGYAVWKYVGDPAVERVVLGFSAAGKYVGAICAGTYVLGKAGLLKDRKATGPTPGKLRRYGARYGGGPVQVDGKVITAKGPAASQAFGKALAEAVTKRFQTLY